MGKREETHPRLTTALKSADSPAAAGPLQLELAKFFYVVAVSLSHAVPERRPAEHGGDEAGDEGPRESSAGGATAGGDERAARRT